MRAATLLLILAFALGANSCRHTRTEPVTLAVASVSEPTPMASVPEPARAPDPASADSASADTATVRGAIQVSADFEGKVRPILESRCQPCHFSGGIMYQRLPFDRPETIAVLGTKLFSRIKDEGEQHLIREYLGQQSR